MLCRVALARADVSEEYSASIIMETRATRHNIPDDGILHSHCLVNLKYYVE
jgi:hypothetical protein